LLRLVNQKEDKLVIHAVTTALGLPCIHGEVKNTQRDEAAECVKQGLHSNGSNQADRQCILSRLVG
ncbi:hypothetical protein NDU88_007540, partial [Pleurodeles waltl]